MKYQKHNKQVKIKKGSSDIFKKANSDYHVEKTKMEILKLIQIYHYFLLKKMLQKPRNYGHLRLSCQHVLYNLVIVYPLAFRKCF